MITEKLSPAEEAAIVGRWRAHVENYIAVCDQSNKEMFVPSAWIEEAEGRPLADLVVEYMVKDHGVGAANPTPGQMYRRRVDEAYLHESTRVRNRHEKGDAESAVNSYLFNALPNFVGEDLHRLIRKFYRRGDCGIHSAVRRAVRSAIENA